MEQNTILVVDDDVDLLQLTAATLRRCGFAVLTASSAVKAFAQVETRSDIDLILTDVVMPGLDGLMLVDMVKLRYPEIRVVYLTSYPHEVARRPGYRYGPTVLRPCRSDELEAAVRSVLSRGTDGRGFRPAL